jgi:hypothetical protein
MLRDVDGDGLASFRIYDYGLGDRFEMPHVMSLAVVPGVAKTARVVTTTPLDVALPQ